MSELIDVGEWLVDRPQPGPPYLFYSAGDRSEFETVMGEMQQLNDFCALLLNAVDERVRAESEILDGLLSGENPVIIPEFGDVTAISIIALGDVTVPMWRDTQAFVTRATTLVLLHTFTEKSLMTVAAALEPKGPAIRQPNGQSKIEAYLEHLRSVCGLAFHEPLQSRKLRRTTAKIRNLFAHGDWDKVRDEVGRVSLQEAFGTVAKLFTAIETSVESLAPSDREGEQAAD